MTDLLSHLGGALMLVGVLLMALPVIRVAPWGYTPLFEAGLALFLFGLFTALAGAIGWIVGGAIAFAGLRYPFVGG